MTTVAMNNLWSYLQGLSLSANEMTWLKDRLDTMISRSKNQSVGIVTSHKTERKLSANLQWLHDHPVNLTDEDLADERTQYILSKFTPLHFS